MTIEIFKYENYKLTLNLPEILLIEEFNRVLEEDKTKNKDKAFNIFKYVWLYCDFKSPYFEMSLNAKQENSLKDSKLTKENLTDSVQALVKKYEEIRDSNPVLRLAKAQWIGLSKVEEYVYTVDLTKEIDSGPQKGKLTHSVRDVRDTVKQIPEMIARAKETTELVKAELKQKEDNIRGNNARPQFEY